MINHHKSMGVRVLFLLPYPYDKAPSQRFRVEAYYDLLRASGVEFESQEFLDNNASSILYKPGSILKKAWYVLKGFFQRAYWVFFKAGSFDFIFIHREAAPVGPPLFEWWLGRVLKKKIIYDFDDAIWIPNISEGNRLARYMKAYWKVKYIIQWSHKVSAGNQFLATYARQFNSKVVYNPTCVDTLKKYNVQASQEMEPVTIGWTGSHSTIPFLASGIPAIQKLEEQERFTFLVICDQKPDFNVRSMQFLPWRSSSEIADLSKIQVGIMPLNDDAWSEGKCGFKIIQYLSLGIPAVASPVGVNKSIIEHGVNGYLCSTMDEWTTCLSELLHDKEKRTRFGSAGKKKIEEAFSIVSNSQNFLSLFTN